MATHLFFDDQWLVRRKGLKRAYGSPELIKDSVYYDQNVNTSVGTVKVIFDERINKYHLYYTAFAPDRRHGVFVSESDDGIHWSPAEVSQDKKRGLAPNCCIDLENNTETVAYFYVKGDKKPYKFLNSECLYGTEWRCDCRLFESADGLNFEKTDVVWHSATLGCEPLGGGFYNPLTESYIINCRPIWGDRRVCYIETKDFKTFSDPILVLQCDSIDEPLMDLQGMSAHWYKDLAVGFLFCYRVPEDPLDKAVGGKVFAQLAYSYNGITFQRSLRDAFLGNGEPGDITAGMVWPSDMRIDENGDVLITVAASKMEHGFFEAPCSGSIATYKLRKDDFIHFEALNGESTLCTRCIHYFGDGLFINLKCPEGKATCAIYDDNVVDRMRNPIEGFTHEDCIPFTGDDKYWTPKFKTKNIEELKGKNFMVEIKMSNGIIYSISGNYQKMMATEIFRYKAYGELPTRKGF